MEELLKELEEAKKKITENEKKIMEIEKKIEEKLEKEKSGRWKPQKGDIYWFISNIGCISKGQWDNHSVDRERYLVGNCFKTKEEAEFAAEKLKVIAELKEFAEPKDAVWDGTKFHCFITWDFWEGGISVKSICTYKGNDIYFSTREDAEKAIAEVGEERVKKYYLQMED